MRNVTRLSTGFAFVVVSLLGSVGVASADDSYPAAAVDRPLLLPSGTMEASTELSTFTYDVPAAPGFEDNGFGDFGNFIRNRSQLRLGIGKVELTAGVDSVLKRGGFNTGQESRFEGIDGGVRVAVLRDLSVGARVTVRSQTHWDDNDFKFRPEIGLRRQLAPRVTVLGNAALDISVGHAWATGERATVWHLVLDGAARYQAASRFAVEVGINLTRHLHEGYQPGGNYPREIAVRARGVATVMPRLDLFVEARDMGTGWFAEYMVGLAVRL